MKPITTFLTFLSVPLYAASMLHGATLYWDGTDTSTNADGGAGTWIDGTSLNWDTLPFAGSNSIWTNGNHTAVFGGTAGTVTLGSIINLGGLQFNTTGYNITSTGYSLNFNATNNSILFNNIAAASITGPVGGSGNVSLSTSNPSTAGILTLNGTSTGGWTGTTTINQGMTLSLSNDNQALNNTSGITLNGGGITLSNASATAITNNRISDSAAITSNGGTISIINTSGAGVYSETIGSVALITGQLNIGFNNNHTSTGSQTLTLSGLTRTGVANTSAVNFSAFSAGPNTTKNMIAVTGAADGFIGAWATTGTGNNGAAQTDYAFITDVGGIKYVTAANISATAENTWASGANVTLSGASTLTGTRTLNTLRYTGNAQTLALGANNLQTYGILNGGSGLLTVSSASTGVLTTPTGGGHLHLNAGNNAITVSAPINDNGGAVTLVKNGAGQLTLSSNTSNFSGGTVLNAGALLTTSDANLGSGGLTVNGIASWNTSVGTARDITINEGAALMLTGTSNQLYSGALSGSGALASNTNNLYTFTNTGNSFTGAVTISYAMTFASIGDSSNAINIGNTNVGSGGFRWTGGSRTLDERVFTLNAAGASAITNNSSNGGEGLIIKQNLGISGAAGARSLTLQGTNTDANTFSGNIANGTDGGISVVSVNKAGDGRWILSGNNTHTGGTTLSAGTLVIGSANALPTAGALLVAGGTLESTIGTLTSGRFIATGGTISASLGGSQGFNKFGTGTTNLNGTANDFTGGITVGGGTLAVAASSTLGQNVSGNSILIRDAGILALTSAAQSGSNQAITLSSSSSGAPVSNTGGGAGPTGRLAVLGLGFNGLPSGAISQANTNGGVIAIRGVTGYNTDLSTLLTGNNLFLGATGSNSTFTGAAGTVVAGNGNLYRLGGGGAQITFNTTNLFTGENGVQVGSTFVNGGGTVVVQAAQDYTGATTVSQGTLTLSGANGSATGSSGFTLNGGRLFLDNGTNNTNRIGNTAAVTLSNGGELHFGGNSVGTTEAFGDLNLGAGYSIVTATAGTNASSLAATGFSRTDNGTALFRGTSLGQSGVTGRVTLGNITGLTFVGASTLNDAANTDITKDVKIIPYLVGATAASGTGDTFVTYDDTLGFRVLNTTNHFNSSITANTNVRLTSAATGITTTSINSLILNNGGTSTIEDGATLTVSSGAILATGGDRIINQAGTTGILDFGANTGYITTVSKATIGAQLNGSGGLVKSGLNELSLTNVNNSFTGDIVLNAGSLRIGANGTLGDAANNIVVNGNAALLPSNVTYARSIELKNGSILNFNAENWTFSGNLTGNGGVSTSHSFSAGGTFSGTGNTFEGPVLISGQGTGNNNYRLTFASLADSAAADGRIVFSVSSATGANGSVFEYTGGTDLNLANRQIELASTLANPLLGHQIRSNGAGTLSIGTDLIVSTPINQTLSLRGVNTGANTFSGKIVDGDGKVSLLKNDAGRWVLSGANTYSGSTLISGGTLELGNALALQNSVLDAVNSINGTASAGLRTSVTALTLGGLNGTKNLSTLFTTDSGGYDSVTALTLNPGAGVTTFYSGAIANGAAEMALTKTGLGTQILSGNNTYTGTTTVSQGALVINGAVASTQVVVNSGASLGGSGVMANATIGGSGAVGPGNSPGILTAAATDPNGGLDYNFEFTAANVAPTYNNASASVNDVLRLTSATPFTDGTDAASLTSANVITLYLNVASLSLGDIFTGGFYTDNNASFLSSISSATFQYFLFDAEGSTNYLDNTYTAYSGPLSFTINTISQNADFGSGDINGYVTQFTVIPEPKAVLLGAFGVLILLRRRR